VNAYFEIKRLKMKFEIVTQMGEFAMLGKWNHISKKKNSLSLSLEFSKVKNDQDEGSRQKDGYTDISCTSKRVDTSNFICM
jgi:hypothetical protein